MTADVEVEAPVFDGPGDSPDVLGVGFENDDCLIAPREFVSGRQTCGTGANHDAFLHCVVRRT